MHKPIRWIASEPERNLDTGISPSDAWSRNIRAQGFTPEERITVEIDTADAYTAERLEIALGTDVVIRRRLRLVDGEPFMIADSYYIYQDVKDTPIARSGDVLPGIYAIFEQMGRHGRQRKLIASAHGCHADMRSLCSASAPVRPS